MFRFFYIIFLLLKYSFLYIQFLLGFNKDSKSKFIKSFFEEAGGAFIKFGQILALRIDILPREYSLDLIELFDQIRPFSYEEVKVIFLQELGVTPEKLFRKFEETPFASASFAQVHAAKLNNNETVVVKIQRPGVMDKIHVDFFMIDVFSALADVFFKIDALPWREFAKEFRAWTEKELDYHIEAENMQRIAGTLTAQKVTSVVIPKIYHKLVTKRIMVQEYIDGVPLSRVLKKMRRGELDAGKLAAMGIDIKETPNTMLAEMLREYFIDGFFHADPHPGNILLLDKGRIGLIDFGIVGEAAPKRYYFAKFLNIESQGNIKEMGHWFLKFAGGDIEKLIISAFPANVDQAKIDGFMALLEKHFYDYYKELELQVRKNLETMKMDYTSVALQTLKFTNRYQIRLPNEMVIFARTMSIMGFLVKEMNYDFKATKVAVDFFAKHPEEDLKKLDTSFVPYKRMNREEAIEKLNNWLAYLVEIDPKLFRLVNDYVSQYNIFSK